MILEQPPAPPRGRICFGVSVSADAAKEIDDRVLELSRRLGLPLTRSSYFDLLARHDRKHKLVENILAAPQ